MPVLLILKQARSTRTKPRSKIATITPMMAPKGTEDSWKGGKVEYSPDPECIKLFLLATRPLRPLPRGHQREEMNWAFHLSFFSEFWFKFLFSKINNCHTQVHSRETQVSDFFCIYVQGWKKNNNRKETMTSIYKHRD